MPAVIPNHILWIVLGIAQFFVCQGSILAIIGTVFAFMSKSEWERGSYETSLRKLKTAKTLIWINLILGVILLIFYVVAIAAGELN